MTTFTGQTTNRVYEKEAFLGEGGQGYVLQARAPDGTHVAIKWYNRDWAKPEQLERINDLIQEGLPATHSAEIAFNWPCEIVTTADSTSFGYMMDLIDRNRFKEYYAMVDGEFSVPLNIICRMCYNFATALRCVHLTGRCYGDINFGNVRFDPMSGHITVLDNDNVVVNNTKSGIGGLLEFMAPEVALRAQPPNRDSDIFSLAVAFYHFFTWHHPLDGKITQTLYSWDQIAKRRFFGEEPLFVFDPRDHSNSTQGVPELKFHEERWRRLCPPPLKALFLHTFTDGLKDQGKRVQIPAWQRAFLECEANAFSCSCGAKTIWSREEWTCFKCGKPVSCPVHLRFEHAHTDDVFLAAVPGVTIRRHSLEPDALDPERHPFEQIGDVETHPKIPGQVILRNKSTTRWEMTTSKAELLLIDPGTARPLVPGAKIQMGNVSCHVEA